MAPEKKKKTCYKKPKKDEDNAEHREFVPS